MVDVSDLRWMRYVNTSGSMGEAPLTSTRMYWCPVGPLAVFNPKSPPPRRQQSPNVRKRFLETGVRRTLGALQDAKGKLYAQITIFFELTIIQTWLICIPSFYSFFYGGTMGTYLSLHFSVRARALSSLLVRK
jgi:hypothetical protein